MWTASGKSLHLVWRAHANMIWSLAFSPDGHALASISRDRTIQLWDAGQGRHRAVLRGHTSGMSGIAFTPDSKRLVTSSEDKTLRVWDVASEQWSRII